jgi:predicted dehydrogenase
VIYLLKIGIIGCGLIADLGHAVWYYKNPEAEIIAVEDPSVRNLKNFIFLHQF